MKCCKRQFHPSLGDIGRSEAFTFSCEHDPHTRKDDNPFFVFILTRGIFKYFELGAHHNILVYFLLLLIIKVQNIVMYLIFIGISLQNER